MNTLTQMRSALRTDLNISENSSLYPTATLNLALNRAYVKAGMFKWSALEDALTTSTQANQEYYEYPDNWKQNSAWRVTIDDDLYGEEPDGSPMVFGDYLLWKDDNENSTKKKWTSQWKRYFVYPTPTTAGSDNITVWGYKNIVEMTEDGSTTIFSNSLLECNEAIVLEAGAILKRKGEDKNSSTILSSEARNIWTQAYERIRAEEAKYEKIQPMFNVPDYYGSTNSKKQITGNF